MGKLGKMIMHLKMMGYEIDEDISDPKVQLLKVKLVLSPDKVIISNVSRHDLLHRDFVIEHIVRDMNQQLRGIEHAEGTSADI